MPFYMCKKTKSPGQISASSRAYGSMSEFVSCITRKHAFHLVLQSAYYIEELIHKHADFNSSKLQLKNQNINI